MRVFVTGGTGFVGPAIVQELLDAGHQVTVLVHKDRGPFGDHEKLHRHHGDVTRADTYRAMLTGHDAVVHLVAIRRAFPERGITFEKMHTQVTRDLVEACEEAGIDRFVYMSANSVKPDGTGYQRTKWQCEEIVKGSGMDWTIFRPSIIVGKGHEGHRGFDEEWADIAKVAPALPNFGGGEFHMQPVAKSDVAKAFARSLENPEAAGETYVLTGPDTFTWEQYLKKLRKMSGHWRPIVPVPEKPIMAVSGALDRYPWWPASREELSMLFEGNVGDHSRAEQDLGVRFTPYDDAAPFGRGR